MLYSGLRHIENISGFTKALENNKNVVIICGRMDQSSIPVYRSAAELEKKYSHIRFFDLEYDNPESEFFQQVAGNQKLMKIPFTVYFKDGVVVKAISGTQSKTEMISILENNFAKTTD